MNSRADRVAGCVADKTARFTWGVIRAVPPRATRGGGPADVGSDQPGGPVPGRFRQAGGSFFPPSHLRRRLSRHHNSRWKPRAIRSALLIACTSLPASTGAHRRSDHHGRKNRAGSTTPPPSDSLVTF